jgi:hypothetical protein
VNLLGRRGDGDVVKGLTGGETLIVKAPPEVKDGTTVKVAP